MRIVTQLQIALLPNLLCDNKGCHSRMWQSPVIRRVLRIDDNHTCPRWNTCTRLFGKIERERFIPTAGTEMHLVRTIPVILRLSRVPAEFPWPVRQIRKNQK